MAETLTGLNKDFHDMLNTSSAAKIHKGEKMKLSMREMQALVREMPEYAFLLNKYILHMGLLGDCME